MTSGLEAVGDVTAGAVLAGAVEPQAGQHGEAGHGACLNCGTPLVGAYCHDCGQNSHLHRSLHGFGHDLLHGVFHFEGKIWNTLPLLFFKPGELTRRYIHGERAKFVSPIAGFLFCVFLMFAVVGSLAGGMHLPEGDEKTPAATQVNSPAALQKEIDDTAKQIATLRAKIISDRLAGRDVASQEERLRTLEDEADGLNTAGRLIPGIRTSGNERGSITNVKTGWKALDEGIARVNENPNLFLYRLQTSAYKYSWALIPISTPLVWLLFFWKRKYKLYDHLVFVTFSLTFMMLFVIALTVIGALGLGGGWVAAAVLIIPPLHMYRQLRGAYDSGRVSALLRTAALVGLGGIGLTLYLLLLLALGVFH